MKGYVTVAIGLVVVLAAFVTPRLAVTSQTVDDVVKAVLTMVSQPFRADPPPYEFVDEALQRASRSASPRLVRVHGYADGIERRGTRTHFSLQRNGYAAQVSFTGIRPGGLVEGNDVIVTGLLSGDTLQATQVSARVPR